MFVIKRDGRKVNFDGDKIDNAVRRAFKDVSNDDYDNETIEEVVTSVIAEVLSRSRSVESISVEEIQDVVEEILMEYSCFDIAKAYIRYRYEHELARQRHNDSELMEMIRGDNDYWTTENSNKNSKWVTTQRDYMAGIVSTDIARNFIFPKKAIEAHDQGIIHIHDMDYAAQNTLTNCCLINLEDVLQNGTVVNGVQIDKPHRLSTAMTIATQVVAAVAASQYGGCTISLTHLAPFVRLSHDR